MLCIPLHYMEKILKYFAIKFDNHTREYLDDDYREKPLLCYKGAYYLLPYVILSSDIINVIISESKEENEKRFDKKGRANEDVVKAKWKNVVGRIENYKGFDRATNTHCECDMAFIFDDCLFICELKNEAQVYSYEDWKRFEIKKDENIAQLVRITNYCKNNNKLKRALNKKSSWMPRKVISLLLYSNSCGKPQKVKDVYVANEQDVFCFFNRTPIRRMEINPQSKSFSYISSYLPGYDYLENRKHRLTIDDFETYMKLPMCTKYFFNKMEKEKANVEEKV